MNTKLGMLKQAALVACCAASVAAFAVPTARADTGYVSIGTGPAYYSDDYYYGPPTRCFYDYYGYYRCRPYYPYGYYYGGPYYGPAISFGYYGGWRGGWWRGRDWDDRMGFRRWRR